MGCGGQQLSAATGAVNPANSDNSATANPGRMAAPPCGEISPQSSSTSGHAYISQVRRIPPCSTTIRHRRGIAQPGAHSWVRSCDQRFFFMVSCTPADNGAPQLAFALPSRITASRIARAPGWRAVERSRLREDAYIMVRGTALARHGNGSALSAGRGAAGPASLELDVLLSSRAGDVSRRLFKRG